MAHEIAPATNADMLEIETWLDAEEAEYQTVLSTGAMGLRVDGTATQGFRGNWDIIKRSWSAGETRVDVLRVNGEVVGFLSGTDTLEIRPDLRGKGFGRLLAEFMIDVAWQEGRSVLKIEIAPSTAEPFWRRMGFTTVDDRIGIGGAIFAYRVMRRFFELGEGVRVSYAIGFYNKQGRYSDNPTPFVLFEGMGERLPDGTVQLPERAYCFEPGNGQHEDYFVKIVLDGQQVRFDKAQCGESRDYGIQLGADYTYFIDRVGPVSET